MSELRREIWGQLPNGQPVYLYTLRNNNGFEATITNFGGRLVTLHVPDKQGALADVVLGFDDLAGYVGPNPYFGALVGRFANRIANGQFALNGKVYRLAKNNGENTLHGGIKGFDKVLWHAREAADSAGAALELNYQSADLEEGFPGNLNVNVTYTLADTNELKIDYLAHTDADTVLNLTNHSYFNLAGHNSGSVLDHIVQIDADRFTPVNSHLVPTGELQDVAGTPFDFREETAIGARIDEAHEQLRFGQGYDHNYVLNRRTAFPPFAARVHEPKSGRILEVFTTQPGVQFYTGNHLPPSLKGKVGANYGFRAAFCLETQHFPDSPNHPEFPSTTLRPGERYQGTTIFRFTTA